MKRILYTLLILTATAFSAGAQESATGINITNLQTEITGEKLNIRFDVTARNIQLKSGGQHKLEFALESGDRRLVLPALVYSGKMRYRYQRRMEELSGAYHIQPYKIFKGVKKNQTYALEYTLDIPYYTWMEHAAVTWREYSHDCSGDYLTASDVLIADLNPAPLYVEPEVWAPNPDYYPNLVSFLQPEVEEVKSRAAMIELNIGFPVNVTEVRPTFGNNVHELQRADSLIRSLEQQNDLITVNALHVRGYASPEGSYTVNERLARGRSESFKQYLVRNYPDNHYVRNAYTSWVPEDWEGFGRLVEASDNIPQKADVLAIVNDPSIAPDTKDRMLQKIPWWSQNYKVILTEMYPKLRRIELRADYTVMKLDDGKARELLYTKPDMLSQDEIYRVAKFYEPGSKQYREVYQIAARQYPNDVIANNNAAAALLQEGNAEEALSYLEKMGENSSSYINYGAYYYVSGDLEKAIEYFTKAKEAGIEQADHNLKLITPGQN